MIPQLAQAHRSWGLGTADRWGLDQQTGLITWTFPDKSATAPAQILASYNRSSGSWMWAWANPSILPEMSRASGEIRDWAQARGHHTLAEPTIAADDQKADTLSALALRITEATGFYRGPSGAAFAIITFGPVTLTANDGSTSTFAINIG
ncbi:hypothetical protein KDL01_08305 [Actinospica durhamensis]|uniref:Uncharacterized protein n=2 Tax=Actinospica durhamensis TaxID=1508375 RepID=A0A941IMV0_9ACTN|nr:hypothetical protein [Actinospica durhamensis]